MRETPCRMTQKLSLASLMTLRMRAAQPTCRVAGARILGARVLLGDDADDGPLLRDGLLDERTDFLRPTSIGMIEPGNSTEFRSGRIEMISGTSTGPSGVLFFAEAILGEV